MGNANRLLRRPAQESEPQLVLDQDVNASDAYGYTMLLLAARDGDVRMVHFLLEHDASVDMRNDYGATALHLAASWGRREIARLLLEHGACVNAADSSGKTPLMRAASNGDTKLVRLLLQHDASLSARDAFGWTAERLAASGGHYKVLVTLRRQQLRRSTASDDAPRWSQRSSCMWDAFQQRLSGGMKDAKPQSEDVPFPSSVAQPSSQRLSSGLKPLRLYPCHHETR
jgi:ankyrin repeat protein